MIMQKTFEMASNNKKKSHSERSLKHKCLQWQLYFCFTYVYKELEFKCFLIRLSEINRRICYFVVAYLYKVLLGKTDKSLKLFALYF